MGRCGGIASTVLFQNRVQKSSFRRVYVLERHTPAAPQLHPQCTKGGAEPAINLSADHSRPEWHIMFDAESLNPQRHPVERRAVPRQRVLLQGKMLSVTNALTGDCLIRNLSKAGARITLRGASLHPSEAILIVIKTGVAHEATTIWFREEERGLQFQSAFDLKQDAPARMRHAYQLWIENLPR